MEYKVKAVKSGSMVTLMVVANHLDEAFTQVKARGYSPISAELEKKALLIARPKPFPLDLFSHELLALLEAGMNLVEAIESLTEKEERTEVKSVLNGLLESLYQGQTLSSAMEQQNNVFPVLYVSTVRASEKTGDMPEALGRYVKYSQQLGLLRKKVISASIYPLLLLSVGFLVIVFLLGFVVPKFSKIYEGTGGELPILSEVLMSWGVLLESHGELVGLVSFGLVGVLVLLLMQPAFRSAFVKLFWKIPSFGKKLKVFQLARFYRTLGMLLKSGTPMTTAMQSVSSLLGSGLQQNMQVAKSAISEGQSISVSFEKANLTTPVALRLLRVGERSGNIGDMMERVANFYDDDLTRWIDWFTKLFEPILMLLIGLVIGVVVLLLYMPIFEMAGNIN